MKAQEAEKPDNADEVEGEGEEKVAEVMEVKAVTYYQSGENYVFLYSLDKYDFFI